MEYKRMIAEINLDSLTRNLRAVREKTPGGVKLLASVKADAYGHGVARVSKLLLDNGADMLGVAICEEGVELREHGITAPALVMGFTPEPMLKEVVGNKLIQTVFSTETAKALALAAAARNARAEVHIKIDTGMGRLGFLPGAESIDAICEIAAMPSLNVTGIYTHLATSDAAEDGFMFEQRARFLRTLGALRERGLIIPVCHMANSSAFARMMLDADEGFFMDMVRTGILLYGLAPSEGLSGVCESLGLKPAMRLVTQVSMVKRLPPGSGISYGHMFRAERETAVATLPVGYADGYPRLLSNKARVLVKGRFAKIVGAICMDQCMADVTDIPGVKPGDEVVMMGEQGGNRISADGLAGLIGTIGYEIICGIGKRVPRVYISDNRR